MNYAYLHLAVNHLPIVGTGIALLLLSVALVRKDDGMLRAGLLVVILSGLGAILAVQSGERAEEQLEHVIALQETVVESHEEAGERAQWLALAAAVLAGVTYVATTRAARVRPWLGWLKAAVVVAVLFALVAVLHTAQTGGRIRHPEVQEGIWQGTAGALDEAKDTEEALVSR